MPFGEDEKFYNVDTWMWIWRGGGGEVWWCSCMAAIGAGVGGFCGVACPLVHGVVDPVDMPELLEDADE